MITTRVAKIVEAACKKPTNYAGSSAWTYHFLPAVKYAKLMARATGADAEIVELAALLHDYASVKSNKLHKDHHIHGARLAEKILKKLGYPQDKTARVQYCILTHRGSVLAKKLTKEARCLADADSMAHFDCIASLLYHAFNSRRYQMTINQAEIWLREKLNRSYKKLSPMAKKIIKDKYKASQLLFK